MAVRVTGLALAFLSHMILSRTLGPSQYGHYVIALGWALVLVIPARLGLDSSVLKYATIYREEGRTADFLGLVIFSLGAIVLVSAVIAGALMAGKAVGLDFLRPVETLLLVGVATLVPFSAVIGWLSSLVRTANRIFAAQFYDQVLRPLLLIAALGAMVLLGRGVGAAQAMLATAATVGIAMIALAIHAKASFAGLPPSKASFQHRGEWLSVSWVLFLTAAVQELLNQVDIILLGILSDATQAAHFAAAWRLASLLPFGLVAIATVSGPLIASAHHRQDMGELARIARLNARFSILFAIVLAAVLIAGGRWVLGLFGPGFVVAYPALLILLVGGLVNSFTGSVGYLLIMTGRQRAALAALALGLGISMIANLLLIPRFGATGAAVASALALSAWNLAMAFHVRRETGIDATALGRLPTRPREEPKD